MNSTFLWCLLSLVSISLGACFTVLIGSTALFSFSLLGYELLKDRNGAIQISVLLASNRLWVREEAQ